MPMPDTAYTPSVIINPYPRNGATDVSYIEFISPYHVLGQSMDALARRGDGDPGWITMIDFEAVVTVGQEKVRIVVPRGMLTDLTSRPRPFRDLIDLVGAHAPASTLHDFLYVVWQDFNRKATENDRLYADNVFLVALKKLRVPQAQLLYDAVRRFGKTAYRERNPVRYVKI